MDSVRNQQITISVNLKTNIWGGVLQLVILWHSFRPHTFDFHAHKIIWILYKLHNVVHMFCVIFYNIVI